MDALLTGRWPDDERDAWLHALQAATPEVRWHLRPADAAADGAALAPELAARITVAAVANPAPGVLAGLPALRLVQSLWAGVEKLLADPTVPPDVPIARMVDPAMNAAMAQTALWATLMLHRGFHRYATAQRAGVWAPHPQRRADEVRVAVLGLGQMGRACALRLREQGYDVRGWTLHPAADAPVRSVAGRAALPGLLGRSEVVINLLPLTELTRGLLDRVFFAELPRGAAIVNLARGAHVVDADLMAALDVGQLGHAVLDVFHTEPLPADHRYWQHPGVTLLPHAAAMTDARSGAAVVVHNLRALAQGGALQHRVDRLRGY